MTPEKAFISTIITYIVVIIIGIMVWGISFASMFSWLVMIFSSLFWLGVLEFQKMKNRKKENLCKKLTKYFDK